MSEQALEIGADGVDTDAIVADIRRRVEENTARGVYADPAIARAERHNLANLKDDEDFFVFYLDCLRHAVYVDINDFEIVERRRRLAGPLVRLKRGIWSLLRFYTYRLWSQQNQVNGLLMSAVETLDGRYRERIETLEKRVAELEGRSPSDG